MIIENGYIEIKSKSVGGIDPETGYPKKPTDISYSKPIRCQWYANTYNWLGKTTNGNNFTRASFVILVDSQELNGEQLRLTDQDGTVIGDFSMMSIEPLQAVDQLKILV